MNRSALIPGSVLLCLLLGASPGASAPTAPAASAKKPATSTPVTTDKNTSALPSRGPAKPPAKPAAKPHNTPAPSYNSRDDRSAFLPDSFLIGSVQDRRITVKDFVSEYFYSYAEFRPKSDSLGRVEFLNTMITKNVLGLTALEVNKPLNFDDRAKLRDYTRTILSNTLFRRYVVDSINVTEADILADYEHYKTSIRIRHIQFESPVIADRVRREMLAGRISWKEAARLYNRSMKDQGPDGELGWASRMGIDLQMAQRVYDLRPGETSQVFEDADGFQIVQVVERRPVQAPSLASVRKNIVNQIRSAQASDRSNQLQTMLANRISLTFDSTNVRFACEKFQDPTSSRRDAKGVQIFEINEALPEFLPADTSRVLARWRDGGRYTLQQFISAYQGIQPVLRPVVGNPVSFIFQLRAFVLEPYMQVYAIERGLDRDTLTVQQLATKTEQIRVEHMVQDSVESKVMVSNEERRKFFAEHQKEFTTFESRRFFIYGTPTKKAADSLAALIRAGKKPEDILLADSLLGVTRGSIQDRREDEHGPLQRIIFKDLRPGDLYVDGPGPDSSYSVLRLLAVTPRRQMTFEQSAGIVDESLQNLKAEAALNALVARHRKRYRITAHPEMVMKVRLLDPSL